MSYVGYSYYTSLSQENASSSLDPVFQQAEGLNPLLHEVASTPTQVKKISVPSESSEVGHQHDAKCGCGAHRGGRVE